MATNITEVFAILISGVHPKNRTEKINLIWIPAGPGLAGNESAHDVAQGFTDRADCPSDAGVVLALSRDKLVLYSNIARHYCLAWSLCPVVWQLLQTPSYPSQLAYSYCYQGRYFTRVSQVSGTHRLGTQVMAMFAGGHEWLHSHEQ